MHESDESIPMIWRVLILGVISLFVASLVAETLTPMAAFAEREHGRQGEASRVDDATVERAKAAYKEWKRSEVDIEIVGGKPVKHGQMTYMAFVLLETDDATFQCGGSLIERTFVLTAAHCVEDLQGRVAPPDDFVVVLGDAEVSQIGAQYVRSVIRVFRHPDWNPATFANDVAILELSSPLPMNIAAPIEYVGSRQTTFDRAGQKALVAGWGAISAEGPVSKRLLRTDLNIVSDAGCANAYASEFIPAVMICAAFRRKDSCEGDSGGPLLAKELIGYRIKKKKRKKGKKRKKKRIPIYNHVQMGVVSWGYGCAEPGFPGVYARLSAPGINDFIVEVTQP